MMRTKIGWMILGLALTGFGCGGGDDVEPVYGTAPDDAGAGDTEAVAVGSADEPEFGDANTAGGPTALLNEYYAAISTGRPDDAVALMVPISDARLRERLPIEMGKASELCMKGELTLEALEHKIQGRWACVVTKHTLTQEGVSDVIVRDEFLLKTSDGWRVADEAMRGDPAVRPMWDSDADALLTWFRAGHDGFTAKYR